MEKKIYDKNYKKIYSINNISNKESRARAVEIVNSIVPKHPQCKLKRFGNFFDGGYILANDLKKTDYLLSF